VVTIPESSVASCLALERLTLHAVGPAFHRSIVAAVGNGRLSEIYADLRIIRSHDLDVLRAGSQVASDHRLILESIRAGNADAAAEAAHRHLAPIRDKMVANLQREQSQA
jgi:DNA-binding GntR family transcriptional regulator